MITCTLNGRKYSVDFITGRALREMEPAAKMYSRIVALSNAALKGELPEEAKELSIPEAMDEMIRWFCILFGNQHVVRRELVAEQDAEPADHLVHGIRNGQFLCPLREFTLERSVGQRYDAPVHLRRGLHLPQRTSGDVVHRVLFAVQRAGNHSFTSTSSR